MGIVVDVGERETRVGGDIAHACLRCLSKTRSSRGNCGDARHVKLGTTIDEAEIL